MATVNTLVAQVQSRLEEYAGSDGDGEQWSVEYELRAHLLEAVNDLTLLVGRPLSQVNVPFTPALNTAWQTVPAGLLLIVDVRGQAGRLRKVSLRDLDYTQSSWSSDWECDISTTGPLRWAPAGLNRFLLHPATAAPITLMLDAIGLAATSAYPYDGTQTIPFHDELFAALEQYAAHVAALKQGGQELQQSLTWYREYLSAAERATEIEDRRDRDLFSPSFGATAGVDAILRR